MAHYRNMDLIRGHYVKCKDCQINYVTKGQIFEKTLVKIMLIINVKDLKWQCILPFLVYYEFIFELK